jgi:hypothetical protein
MHLGSKVLVAVAAHANATARNRMAKHKSAITVQIVVAFVKDEPRCEVHELRLAPGVPLPEREVVRDAPRQRLQVFLDASRHRLLGAYRAKVKG